MAENKPWALTIEDLIQMQVNLIKELESDMEYQKLSGTEKACESAGRFSLAIEKLAQKKLLAHLKLISVEDYEISRFHGIGLAIKHEDLKELEESLE